MLFFTFSKSTNKQSSQISAAFDWAPVELAESYLIVSMYHDVHQCQLTETLPTINMTGPREANHDQNGLLSLPPEIRAQIFGYVLEAVRCRRPLIAWDDICTGIATHKSSTSIAILLTCRTAYEDAMPILYDLCTVEITVRSDLHDESFPRFQISLGPISSCPILSRVRNIELEISYDARNNEAVARAARRVQELAAVFKETKQLKTLDLILFDQGRITSAGFPNQAACDPILIACMELECERFLRVSRNLSAKRKMSESKWQVLRKKAGVHVEAGEAFRDQLR